MAMKKDDGLEMSEQDERIAGLYRRISVEDPPPYLDARIAEAARLEPGSRVAPKRPAWWVLWRVPFAVAAVAVVSVSLVSLMMEHEGGELTLAPEVSPPSAPVVDPTPVASQPQPEIQPQRGAPTRAQQSQTGARGYDKTDAPAERRALARESSQGRERPAASPPGVVAAPEPPPAAPPAAMRDAAAISESSPGRAEIGAAAAARDSQKEQAQAMSAPAPAPAPLQSRAAAPASAPAPARAPAPAGSIRAFKRADAVESEAAVASAVSKLVVELSARPPAEWLERVATLRREGRRPEADALLEEFRRRFPDQPIPADLREREVK